MIEIVKNTLVGVLAMTITVLVIGLIYTTFIRWIILGLMVLGGCWVLGKAIREVMMCAVKEWRR
jgi:hypothetical protein